MVRGLDGIFIVVPSVALCGFEGPPGGAWSRKIPVVMARGKHLFPFRTEQLSPSAPMVLGPQGPGRVGRRRLFVGTGRPSGRPVLRCTVVLPAHPLTPVVPAQAARLAPVQTRRLELARVVLRPIAEEDVEALAALDALPEIRAAI